MLRILMFLVFLSFLYGCVKKGEINIKPEKTPDMKYINYGVWAEISKDFERAESFDGFQAPYYQASISVKFTSDSIEKIKNSFKSHSDLIEMRPVKYGDIPEGIFIKFEDNKRGIIRYLLAVQDKGKMIQVRAFYQKGVKDKFESQIENSLKSIYVDEGIFAMDDNLEEEASTAELIVFENGKFLNSSYGNVDIEVKSLNDINKMDVSEFLGQEIFQLTGFKPDKNLLTVYTSGKIYQYSSSQGETWASVILATNNNQNEGIYFKCVGKKGCDIEGAKESVLNKLIKVDFNQ